MKKNLILFIFSLVTVTGSAQTFQLTIKDIGVTSAKIQTLQGEKIFTVDSVTTKEKDFFRFSFKDKKYHHGFYRIFFEALQTFEPACRRQDYN